MHLNIILSKTRLNIIYHWIFKSPKLKITVTQLASILKPPVTPLSLLKCHEFRRLSICILSCLNGHVTPDNYLRLGKVFCPGNSSDYTDTLGLHSASTRQLLTPPYVEMVSDRLYAGQDSGSSTQPTSPPPLVSYHPTNWVRPHSRYT